MRTMPLRKFFNAAGVKVFHVYVFELVFVPQMDVLSTCLNFQTICQVDGLQ